MKALRAVGGLVLRKPVMYAAAVDATFTAWVLAASGWSDGVQAAAVLACKAWTAALASSLSTSTANAADQQAAARAQGAAETETAVLKLAQPPSPS